MRINRILLALLTTIVIQACTSPQIIPTVEGNAEHYANWQKTRDQLQTIASWEASGKAALKNNGDGTNLNLVWQQSENNSQLTLSGPLGQGLTTIRADEKQAEFIQGEYYYLADDLDQLVAELSALSLPVNGLKYWLIGLPAPYAEAKLIVNEDSQLAALHQFGWQVEFQQFELHDSLPLPTRIFAQRSDQSAKVILKSWSVELP